MDALELSKKVRDYFSEVHGQFAVLFFRVEAVEYGEEEWLVECSFLPAMTASEKERVYYKVIISVSGEIKNVTKVVPAPT